ncbi:MAG: hypothetical protein VX495_01805 [Nitrospinota bacterium]|nr:hypothetical protein [Nitrospinota bacterium]MEC9019230.1 hypothetical protein [Nitrospinota bacterium]MEC9423143.1 hypothetical protein [Nitrospinota bacterium]MED5353287.1 hypothetical protein [Nitrospinota bacterium]
MQDIKSKIEDLTSVVEKLAIEIQITNLNDQDFHIQSGYCKLNGKDLILLDKNLSLQEQTEVILQALKNFDLDSIYVASWIRELIEIESSRDDPPK